ncbi:hypothetical protein IAD21_03574 [Abditibacteriota bacterium]|nr:hypothetical protein IAD21_03574 [Abditibacteriota bacterium]
MLWKNWSWSGRIFFVIGLGFLYAILYPVFARQRASDGPGPRSCQPSLKQIGLGFFQYQQDYDEKFPPIISGGSAYGWADALQPYIKSTWIYQCPSSPDKGQMSNGLVDPLQNGYTDYPFNANLDQISSPSLPSPSLQIVSLDGNDGLEATNARYCLTQIPPQWLHDESSPLHRHFSKTGNYLFADGHVKSYTPSQFSSNKNLVF